MGKKKKKQDKFPRPVANILSHIEEYAQLREEYYHLSDIISSSTQKRLDELPTMIDVKLDRITNLLKRMHRKAVLNRYKYKVEPVPEQLAEPEPVVARKQEYKVIYKHLEMSGGVLFVPEEGTVFNHIIEAPTRTHAEVLTKRIFGDIKVLEIIDLLKPPQEVQDGSEQTPGQ